MLYGIDISSWQSGISIASVPSDFVIVKATEGTGYISPSFYDQANQTLDSGKLLGIYHFAGTGSAYDEADFFVDSSQDFIDNAALFLDYEADALNNGSEWAYYFLSRVQERTGHLPGVYMSKTVCNSQDWTWCVDAGYPLWVAQYASNNSMGYVDDPWTDGSGYGAWDSPTLFQYTSSGNLDGYSGNLDLNLFYGDRDYWIQLFCGGNAMDFNGVWFDEALNDEKSPAYQSLTTPGNLLWETAVEVENNKNKLAEIEQKLDNLQVNGASVDYNKLAKAVCDELVERLKA